MTAANEIAAVLAGMQALPLRQFGPDELPLAVRAAYLRDKSRFALINGLPMANATRSADGVKNEAQRIRDAAKKLWTIIEKTHGDTLEAIERASQTDPQKVPMQLHPLLLNVHIRALANLAHCAAIDAPPQLSRRGNVERRAAAQVADLALVEFEDLTGQRGSRRTEFVETEADVTEQDGGPFIGFLDVVFRALKLSESARSQGRKAIDRRRRAAGRD